nr:MAG TPA: hypothetical protein [Caudoviricetes sp.]
MKNPRIDFKELDYFLKALAAFDSGGKNLREKEKNEKSKN